MPKVSYVQQSFNAGELSPLMAARQDIAKAKNGLTACLNAIVLTEGAWTRRPGEYYVAPTKAWGVARLQRFEFSTTQAYMLEFGLNYIRFYKDNGAIVETAKVITAITAATPPVVTSAGHSLSNGDSVEIAGIVGMTQLNSRRFVIANAAANTFELQDIDSTNIVGAGYTAYTSGGTASRVYTVTTTYAAADLVALKFTQSADTIYITHPLYAPAKLTRTAHTSWTLATPIMFQDGPYLPVNSTATTLALSGISGSVTVTASAAAFTVTTDIGRLIRWKDPANNWTWLTITATASTTSVTATISGPNASAGTATVNWRLGVWSITTGFPAACGFYQNRLCFGGPTLYPQRIDGSSSGLYEDFAPSNAAGTIAADNAFSVTLASSDVNAIRWILDDEKGLMIGTVGGEWILRPASTASAFSALNVEATRSTTYGSANMQPLKAGKTTLYVQRAGRKLRELAYVYQIDGFKAPNMNRLSSHITYGGITQIAYQQETGSIVWGVRTDGVLTGFTYERDEEVFGWHRHIFGGYSDVLQQVAAKVESVGTIPAADGARDETWVIVKRYVNGKTVRHVGYLKKPWEHGHVQADAFFVDAGLTLDNTVAATLTPGTNANVDASAGVIFTAGSAVFAPTDVDNRYIHYDFTDSAGVLQRASALITGYTSTTIVTGTILYPWPNLTLIAPAGWRMSVASVGGLWHLEGQSVNVFADGAVQPVKTVASGTITLSYPASKLAVGLGYNSDGQMLVAEAGAADGSSLGKLRRCNRVVFWFLDTVGAKIGRTFSNLVPKVFRTAANPLSLAVPLYSGHKRWEWEGDYDTTAYICWRQDQPEPMTVLAIMPQLDVQDGS